MQQLPPAALAKRLTKRLTEKLPGRTAHRPFLPGLSYGRYYHAPPRRARKAAVMALLYPSAAGEWVVPLTLRPTHLKDHGGQICFPGGAIDPNDHSIEDAALRELQEELAVPSEGVQVVGRLSPIFVFGSGFYVTPVVALCAARPVIVPNPDEVAELIEVPTNHLLDQNNYGRQSRALGVQSKVDVDVGYIQFERHRVWGATAIMLGELIEVLRGL